MNNKSFFISLFGFILCLVWVVGCNEGNPTEPPAPMNREAVVELYLNALEQKDANAILALHHPQNLPDPSALSHKIETIGGQRIEVIELTFLNEFGTEITSVRITGKLGIPGRATTEFTERFTLSRRQDGRWYLYIGEE
jgi:hypothetical protein